MGLLAGKRALITMSDRYMGPDIATVFAEEGAEVVCDSDPLRDPEAPARIVAKAGRVDILVANLAEYVWWSETVPNIRDSDWLEYFEAMVHPLMRLTRAVLPQMIECKAGKILAVTSAAPLRGIPKASGYCAARGAQNAFVRAAGLESARHNIQINAIAQNYVENPTYYPPELLADEALVKRMLDAIPAKRLAKGRESAQLAAFLASDRADFIVGQVVPFSGGWVTTTG
jgi:2-keto-3-deoxy-L-fuconate dehydrogenase